MATSLIIFLLATVFCLFAGLIRSFDSLDSTVINENDLTHRINALLPQTQCGKCQYDGCQPYARAIARGKADINRCPPGGDESIEHIAALLGRDSLPLHTETVAEKQSMLALIDEELCIGCVKCIQACPVDAILGAAKQIHTVIERSCTGCELCIAPCPVDCISMTEVNVEIKKWVWTKPPGLHELSP
jgi:electron transport complex protein RnfB